MAEENNITDEDFSIGSIIDERYLIEKILGEGGQAIAVKALDTRNYDNPVVIKALKRDVTDKWSSDKFREEQRALAKLQGATGIVNLIDNGKTKNGRQFAVLEFVDGELLSDLIDDLPKNLPRVARLFQQITSAVEYAHRKEIYHRDLKPENIIVANPNTKDELIKIIDFGIAKQIVPESLNVELTTGIMGTPYYISPNALDGKPNPKLDDIYALGMISYTMVTGQYPVSKENFSFPKLRKMQNEITNYPPSEKNKSLLKSVDEAILKALSENPAERYESAEDFGTDLSRALFQQIVDKTQLIEPANKKRNGKVRLFIVSLILLGLLLSLWAIFSSIKPLEIVSNPTSQNSNQPENITTYNTNSNILTNSSNILTDSSNSNAAQANAPAPAPAVSPEQSLGQNSESISPSDFSIELAKQVKGDESVPTSTAENFKTGDGIRLTISSEKNGFLQIFLKDGSGKSRKVKSSEINAGKNISFPTPKWIYFDDKPGTETIYVVVSKQNAPEKIDVSSLNRQSNGKTEFLTEKGSAVRVIKLNHNK